MFLSGSRYQDTGEDSLTGPDGRELRYKLTRFIPDTPAVSGHIVTGGERLDQLAFFYYRKAERFWRIADANQVMDPAELEATPGRKINIPGAT